ncbi:MAG: 50S ribosomal protein L11 methyltransferase [Bacillota bacterium]
MQWIETVVHTTTAGSDLVSDLLMRCGALGTQVMDRKDVAAANQDKNAWELFDETLVNKMPADVLVKGWFSQEERQNLNSLDKQLSALKAQSAPMQMGTLSVEISTVADDDWAEGWKRYYKPFRIGRHLIVKPTWEPYRAEDDDLVVEMDPGMAFGTGTHETTNMCMILLEKYVKKGMRVMDIGTGSGILAITAAKLGAEEVLCVDIDPDAVKVAKENIKRNAVQDTTTAAQGDMVRGEAIPCDLAIANIVAGAISVLAEPIKRYLRVGGYFICSGIIREREQDVLDSFQQGDYAVVERLTQNEWVAFCARREK